MLPLFLRTPKPKRKTHIDADKSAGGGGLTASGVPTHLRVRFRSHSASRSSSLFRSRLVRTRARHAPSTGQSPAPSTFVTKQNKCSVSKNAASPHFFPYSEKFFRLPRLPLILLETIQGFFFRAVALSQATAPAPTLLEFVLSVSRAPTSSGAHFCFCLPARGGVMSFSLFFRGALRAHFSTWFC